MFIRSLIWPLVQDFISFPYGFALDGQLCIPFKKMDGGWISAHTTISWKATSGFISVVVHYCITYSDCVLLWQMSCQDRHDRCLFTMQGWDCLLGKQAQQWLHPKCISFNNIVGAKEFDSPLLSLKAIRYPRSLISDSTTYIKSLSGWAHESLFSESCSSSDWNTQRCFYFYPPNIRQRSGCGGPSWNVHGSAHIHFFLVRRVFF